MGKRLKCHSHVKTERFWTRTCWNQQFGPYYSELTWETGPDLGMLRPRGSLCFEGLSTAKQFQFHQGQEILLSISCKYVIIYSCYLFVWVFILIMLNQPYPVDSWLMTVEAHSLWRPLGSCTLCPPLTPTLMTNTLGLKRCHLTKREDRVLYNFNLWLFQT